MQCLVMNSSRPKLCRIQTDTAFQGVWRQTLKMKGRVGITRRPFPPPHYIQSFPVAKCVWVCFISPRINEQQQQQKNKRFERKNLYFQLSKIVRQNRTFRCRTSDQWSPVCCCHFASHCIHRINSFQADSPLLYLWFRFKNTRQNNLYSLWFRFKQNNVRNWCLYKCTKSLCSMSISSCVCVCAKKTLVKSHIFRRLN